MLLSSFFSASETGLVSLSKFKIKKIVQNEKRFASFFDHWLRQPQYYLATILVGNNLVNILFSTLLTYTALNTFSQFDRSFVEAGSWLSSVFLVLIFGEIIPKSFSRQHPEKVTLSAVYLLKFFSSLFRPINHLIVSLTKKFFPATSLSSLISREEIKILISDISEEGMIDAETTEMMQKTIKLCETNIGEIMTSWDKVETMDIKEEPNILLDRLVESGRTRVPVYFKDKENIKGYIYLKDLLFTWQNEEKISLDRLIRPINFVSQEKKVSEILEEFKKGRTQIFIVTDANQQPVGLVTLEDILEEVVGEILDEYDLKIRWKSA